MQYVLMYVQVAQAAVARGIAMDGTIGFLLLKTCYTSIRTLWARTHAQIAAQRASTQEGEGASLEGNSFNDSASSHTATSVAVVSAPIGGAVGVEGRAEWAGRMIHALTGRAGVPVCEEGAKSARDWRDRAHRVYRYAQLLHGIPCCGAMHLLQTLESKIYVRCVRLCERSTHTDL